jgi:hypothetical protein
MYNALWHSGYFIEQQQLRLAIFMTFWFTPLALVLVIKPGIRRITLRLCDATASHYIHSYDLFS